MGVSVWTFQRTNPGEPFLPSPGAATPAQPLDVCSGENLRMPGYNVAPQIIQRGESAVLITCFELQGRMQPGWNLFFHLEGPGGFRNLDQVPVEGAYPMERWRPSQCIRDRLPVYVGLFKGNDRAPVTPSSASHGRDRLRLATVAVQW